MPSIFVTTLIILYLKWRERLRREMGLSNVVVYLFRRLIGLSTDEGLPNSEKFNSKWLLYLHPFSHPRDRASFATSSRLLSCLIAESLLKAIFVPACDIPLKHFIGAAIVLTSSASKRDRPYNPDDIFAIIPLRHIPVFKPRCKDEIGLLDPWTCFHVCTSCLTMDIYSRMININVCKLLLSSCSWKSA
jgi:hypothetical protein